MRNKRRGKMVPGYVSSWIKEEVEERNTFWIKRRKGRRNGAGRAGGVRKRKDNGEWWRRRIKKDGGRKKRVESDGRGGQKNRGRDRKGRGKRKSYGLFLNTVE